MAMKEKNSLPDMYSPEKKFLGFFCVYGLRELKAKAEKELTKLTPKKESAKPPVSLRFTFLYILHIVQKAAGKAAA